MTTQCPVNPTNLYQLRLDSKLKKLRWKSSLSLLAQRINLNGTKTLKSRKLWQNFRLRLEKLLKATGTQCELVRFHQETAAGIDNKELTTPL